MKVMYSVVAVIFLSPVGLVCGQEQKPQAPPAPATQVSVASMFASYPNLEAQAKEFGDAYVRKDNQRLMELTYPKMFEVAGGEEHLMSEVVKGESQLRAEGLQVLSWTPTDVTQLLSDAGSLYAVLPMTMRMKVRDELFDSYHCLIGISNDQGQHWTFVPARCVKLRDMFPQVADKLVLCPEKDPGRVTDH
jgi:hypothetical protein